MKEFVRKPSWLKVKSNTGEENQRVMNMLRDLNLHTVCEEAGCPNCGECFGRKTATFMILGNKCTRNCRFCNVTKALPCEVDENEPDNIAMAVKNLGLKHVVVTSVSRDDLVDGGSGHFAKVIHAIREKVGDSVIVEVLIPDFGGQLESLKTVIDARPDIINHNVETVPRLYPMVRPMADYQRSLELVGRVKEHSEGIVTKSGIMVGLGETFEEVVDVFKNLREVDCDILTIGQYLSPSKEHLPVYEYVHPDLFEEYKKRALELGFRYVASGPLVRSSYMAEEAYKEIKDS